MPIDEHLCSKHIISPNIYFVNSFFIFFIIVLNISDNALQVQPEKGHIIIQTRQSEFVPYTVIIIMNESTVINRLSKTVTSHKGILAQKPVFSTACSIAAENMTDAPQIE